MRSQLCLPIDQKFTLPTVDTPRFARLTQILPIALIIFGVTILSAIPRLLAARDMAWLNDEIVFIEWLGFWFSEHGFEYILQSQHTFYPPMSPVFANPPLFPLLVGGALDLANVLHIAPLLASRLVSLVAGSLTCGVAAWIAFRLWGRRAAILSGVIVALLPVAVVSSASAYVEGLLTLEVTVLFALLVVAYQTDCRWVLGAAGVVSGLGILTKLSAIPFIVGAAVLLMSRDRPQMIRFRETAAYLGLCVLVPIVLWPGARDPRHILAVVHYVTAVRPTIGLIGEFPDEGLAMYYPLMIVGTLPAVLIAAVSAALVSTAARVAVPNPSDRWLVAIAGFIALFVGFVTLTVGVSSRHQIAPIEPFIALAAGALILKAVEVVPAPHYVRHLAVSVIVLGSFLPLLTVPPTDYNAFSNFLVGGPWGSSRYYLSGDGEGFDRAAQWVNTNTPPGTFVATVAQSYNAQKYLTNGRRVVPVFTNERIDAAAARGASWVVLYASQIWSGQTSTMASSAQKLSPTQVIAVAGAPDIIIYDVRSRPEARHSLPLNWTPFQKNPDGEVLQVATTAPDATQFQFQFNGAGLHWGGLVSDSFVLDQAQRVALHLDAMTTSDSNSVIFDLLPSDLQPRGYYLRYMLPLPPVLAQGPPVPFDVEVPLDMFQWVDSDGRIVVDNEVRTPRSYRLRVVVDSNGPATGRVGLSRIALVSSDDAIETRAEREGGLQTMGLTLGSRADSVPGRN